jgi:vacuolar-type H+-ATPase subunit H
MTQKLETVQPAVQGVRAMEETAARLLEDARAEGAEILSVTRRQAEELAAAALPLDDVAAECTARVEAARAQARQRVLQAEAEAEALRTETAGKLGDCAAQIVRIVSGDQR